MNIRFNSTTLIKPVFVTRFDAKRDAAKPGFYSGVLIIEKGFAKGHYAVKDGTLVKNYDPENPSHVGLMKYPIHITDQTLNDVVACGNSTNDDQTKCKLDHGSTVLAIVGNYNNFRRDGDGVRADLSLFANAQYRAHAMDIIDNCSKNIGNSIDFNYGYEIEGNVAIARCRKLNSVDIVDSPAATKSLFNDPTQPNNTAENMPLSQEDLNAIGNLVDTKLTSVETKLATRFSGIESKITKLEDGGSDDDEKKKKKDDDDKTGLSAKNLDEVIGKAVLSAVTAHMPRVAPVNTNDDAARTAADAGKSTFEKLVDSHVALGAPRGIAIQRAAKDNKTAYNEHMKKENSARL